MIFIFLVLIPLFIYIIYKYAKGLKDSPREIWILLLAKLIEYAAYGASNLTFVLFLSEDSGLGDIAAGSYIGTWSMLLTLLSALVGSIVDAIGVKRTLLLGGFILAFGRMVMPFSTNLYVLSAFAFIPVAFGNAVLGPVLSVGIKKYTTPTSSALGFGLYYTLMNVGFAFGGYIFDKVRTIFGEHGKIDFLIFSLSSYQLILLISFILTIPTILMFFLMRNSVYLNLNGEIKCNQENTEKLSLKILLSNLYQSILDIIRIMKTVFIEKSFWIYLFSLGIFVFIKLVFYHFHYTFPKYGIRLLGEGVKVGNLYGILNPVLIIFLVPIFAHLTKKIKSYKVLLLGTFISSISIFIAAIPGEYFYPLINTFFGKLVLNDWLEINPSKVDPVIFSLLFFILFFTIGEAIWSPRLFQYSAEIAPLGKEGTYLALSYLPYFLAKMIAGPFSGYLLSVYVPANSTSYPNHYMIWLWIGGISVLTPIGLIAFNKLFRN
jgi:MFS family permease